MGEDWYKNKLLGDIAENIIEFLISSMSDWKCNKFGVETHIKDIQDMIRENKSSIATKIRKMPDFVAFNEKTKETFFIEVKYRKFSSSGRYSFKYLEDYNNNWEGTKLILVLSEKPHFVYIDLKKLNFSMREMKKNGEKSIAYWDLKEVGQDIKDLFPDLKDERIEEAIKMIIPKRDN